MPKIDISKIPNYDSLPEDVKNALSSYEIEDVTPDYTGYVKKEVLDAKSREAAELSRKLKEKMTEDEQKEANRLEEEQRIKQELETLRKDKAISDNKAKFLGLGYAEDLAGQTAEALASGDMGKVFENQALHIETVKKAAIALSLAGDPKPPAGGGGATEITKEQFNEMGYSERLKVFNEQPELFKQFTEV